MDSSRRAVESYWRSRMVDAVTSDEDKVAPVYKLEEVCELLRSSHASIVKEVSEFILKRLDHKNPVVKQKVLRLIKFSVGKSGVEFRREMQKNSATIRQLFHYKGHPDPLKGDALNKAVRDTAHEAVNAVFASDDYKPSHTDDISKRIQGFGSTNFDMSVDSKKSFLSEIVDIGSASIRQGLSTITASHLLKINDSGSYKGPNLRRSLTKEVERSYTHEGEGHSRSSSGISTANPSQLAGRWGQDSRPTMAGAIDSESDPGRKIEKSREERLLETIVAFGGVRLQPTRDSLQVFVAEAAKMDLLLLSNAIESKLQSNAWQVRLKALCVLEALLRKKDDTQFHIIGSHFSENQAAVFKCLETPQVSLRETASRVISLLNKHETLRNSSTLDAVSNVMVEMPDLIDTSGPVRDDKRKISTEKRASDVQEAIKTSDDSNADMEDPFADVSFHGSEERPQTLEDIFSGLGVDDAKQIGTKHSSITCCSAQAPDIFPVTHTPQTARSDNMTDLLTGTPIDAQLQQLYGDTVGTLPDTALTTSTRSAKFTVDSSLLCSMTVPYNHGPSLLSTKAANLTALPRSICSPISMSRPVDSFYAQKQLLSGDCSFQKPGNIHEEHMGGAMVSGNTLEDQLQGSGGAHISPFPDIFSFTARPHDLNVDSNKKMDSRAFDFIGDHIIGAKNTRKGV